VEKEEDPQGIASSEQFALAWTQRVEVSSELRHHENWPHRLTDDSRACPAKVVIKIRDEMKNLKNIVLQWLGDTGAPS
jgi:hypothetical protein